MYCLRLRSEEEGGISSVTPSPNHNFEERDPERREEDREADPERREEDRAEEDPERREDFEEADFDAFGETVFDRRVEETFFGEAFFFGADLRRFDRFFLAAFIDADIGPVHWLRFLFAERLRGERHALMHRLDWGERSDLGLTHFLRHRFVPGE